MATPGQARRSLVRASPCLRLMRGPSRHHDLVAASTPVSIVSSVGPAGRHQHRRSGMEVAGGRGCSWNGPRRPRSARTRWGPPVRVPDPAGAGRGRGRRRQEVRTDPRFTSSLEALADWLQTEGVRKVVMEATGQQLEALLVGAGGARAGAAAGRAPATTRILPGAARPTSATPPGSCELLRVWAAAGQLRGGPGRLGSCGSLSATPTRPRPGHGAECQRIQQDPGGRRGSSRVSVAADPPGRLGSGDAGRPRPRGARPEGPGRAGQGQAAQQAPPAAPSPAGPLQEHHGLLVGLALDHQGAPGGRDRPPGRPRGRGDRPVRPGP
jgi:hypothetical protein